jgi:hypothetical protein
MAVHRLSEKDDLRKTMQLLRIDQACHVIMGSRRRRKTALLVFIATLALTLVVFNRAASLPGPAPFYCSTWDSATPAFSELRDNIRRHYNQWVQYDSDEFVIPLEDAQKLARRDSTLSSLLHQIPTFGSDKPKGMASSSWKKPKGFKIVAMIFCM